MVRGCACRDCDFITADIWEFQVTSGETVSLIADTVDAATAADLCFLGGCLPSLDSFFGDDEFACTFPPPVFACPSDSFVATADATCTVSVEDCGLPCSDPNTANYVLDVTRNGSPALLTLIQDDSP